MLTQAFHFSDANSGLLGRTSAARGSGRNSHGRALSDALRLDRALDGDLLGHALQRVLGLELLQLDRSVLLKERIDGEEATTDTDLDVVLLDLDHNLLGAELVDTLRLTHEHDLELASLGVVVDVLGEASVDGILLDRDVNGNTLLKVNDVLLEGLDLDLSVLELLQQLEGRDVGSVHLLLERDDVVRIVVELLLKGSLLSRQLSVESLRSGELGLDVLLSSDDLLEGDDGRLKALDLGLERLDGDVLLVDLGGRGGAQLLELLLKLRDSLVLGNTHLNEKKDKC